VAAGALLASAACDLGPLDLTGRRCDASRTCGDGWLCHQGACWREGTVVDGGADDAGADAGTDDAGAPDGGPGDAGPPDAGIPFDVNVLANGDFESLGDDGGVVGWRASPGRLLPSETSHGGARAARLEAVAAQQPALLPRDAVPGTALGMLFCARAWVRSEGDAGVDFTLTIRDRFSDGGLQSSAGMRVNGVRDGWRELREEHVSFGNSSIELRLGAATRLDAGQGFWVDDVQLFRSSGPVCP
jgi:hypothetical protein